MATTLRCVTCKTPTRRRALIDSAHRPVAVCSETCEATLRTIRAEARRLEAERRNRPTG